MHVEWSAADFDQWLRKEGGTGNGNLLVVYFFCLFFFLMYVSVCMQ